MIKPVIFYDTDEDVSILRRPDGHFIARLNVIDHPRLGSALIGTSRVVNFDPATGTIETRNSVYRPKEQPDDQDRTGIR